ncbi:MAG TPA: DNA cytosine methyltransferase, partial [Armatimonadota bacterium]|nr:DNA cytosine methyltransferase [Armatimonadota bacterium]
MSKFDSVDVVDLFAGPGGWDVGLRMIDPHLSVLGVEWDEAACQTAEAAGFPRLCGDVRKFDSRQFPNAKGLIASPPCPTFSAAGNGSGRRQLNLVIDAMETLWRGEDVDCDHFEDERTALVLEPMRWVLEAWHAGHAYRWIALEQVPGALPAWEAMVRYLKHLGYSVATGILNAEQYGVPQTRKRAVLIASLDHEVQLPTPTHSRYYPRAPHKLDPGVKKWVSMAEALGWGMAERPSMTVTGGGAETGGAEPFGTGARRGMLRAQASGSWEFVMMSNYGTGGDASKRGLRSSDQPAPTITSKVDRNKVYLVDDGNFAITGQARNSGPGASRRPHGVDDPSYTIRANGSG